MHKFCRKDNETEGGKDRTPAFCMKEAGQHRAMELNSSQKRAVAHLAGPMMVLAGPGSGKTSVIVQRTSYLIHEGCVPPSSVLVVTFSRAAAAQMKERFLKAENITGTYGYF